MTDLGFDFGNYIGSTSQELYFLHFYFETWNELAEQTTKKHQDIRVVRGFFIWS